jgi:hypothetical protein
MSRGRDSNTLSLKFGKLKFGKKIRALRKTRNWTQADMSAHTRD